jgi:hypothetical protein
MSDTEHNRKQDDRIAALEKGQTEILELLRPISETYKTASTLGKWVMGLLVFLSVGIGVLLGLKEIVWKQ